MRSRIPIKIVNWRKPSASLRYIQLSELHQQLDWTLTISLHEDKVLNFIKINESLEWFGTVMRSRIRSKIGNWSITTALLRYIQLNELHHYLEWTLTISLHEEKVLNFIKINESLEWFVPQMRSRIRSKIGNWSITTASLRYIQLNELHH